MRFFKIIFLLYFISLNVYSWRGANCPSTDSLQALAEKYISNLPPVTGLSIAIYNPHCGSYTFTYGKANIETHATVNDDTLFPIASNTKPLLAAMVLIWIERNQSFFPQGLQTKLTDIKNIASQPLFTTDGKIRLSDNSLIDLTDSDFYQLKTGKTFSCKTDSVYQCPQFDKIDIKHLLIESSGLADVFNDTDTLHSGIPDVFKVVLTKLLTPGTDSGNANIQTDLQTLKFFGVLKKAEPDPIIPIQSHNTDAMLLAVILEQTSGKTLNQLLNELILQPLHLENDSIRFLTTPNDPNANIARQYVYLNSDAEIEMAIANKTLLPGISDTVARMLEPTNLIKLGRNVLNVTIDRHALDILALHGQGFLDVGGAGGIIAKPKAYARFYHALVKGELLTPNNQALFLASFIPQTSDIEGYTLKVGFGSNRYIEEINGAQKHFLTHGGLVLGGESRVLYDYDSKTTFMITSDYSGYHGNNFPCMFVTPTPYLGYDAIYALARDYGHLFGAHHA